MAELTIEQMLEIARAATPGPWKADGTIYEHMVSEIRSIMPGEERGIAQVWQHPQGFADARFIAAANPATVLSLLAALEEAEGRMTRQKNRGDNHWETLRSIREIARTTGDLERIIQWVNDAGQGYLETAETTLAAEMDRARAATARAEASEQRVAGLIGVLTEIAFDPIPMSEVIAKARAALTTKSGEA